MSLTLEQIAKNVELWQWREETGGELELFFGSEWIAASPGCTPSSVATGLYRKKPQPQVRWVNFYNDDCGRSITWRMHLTEGKALSVGDAPDQVARAIRVEFPPGTFEEES